MILSYHNHVTIRSCPERKDDSVFHGNSDWVEAEHAANESYCRVLTGVVRVVLLIGCARGGATAP